jgi:hypothetical protein
MRRIEEKVIAMPTHMDAGDGVVRLYSGLRNVRRHKAIHSSQFEGAHHELSAIAELLSLPNHADDVDGQSGRSAAACPRESRSTEPAQHSQ